jgi:hypothetical protein
VDSNTEQTIAYVDDRGSLYIRSVANNTIIAENALVGTTVVFNRHNGNYVVFGNKFNVMYEFSAADGSLVRAHKLGRKLIGQIFDVLVDQHGTFVLASYSGICLYYPITDLVSCLDTPSPLESDFGNVMVQTSNGSIYVLSVLRTIPPPPNYFVQLAMLIRLDPTNDLPASTSSVNHAHVRSMSSLIVAFVVVTALVSV